MGWGAARQTAYELLGEVQQALNDADPARVTQSTLRRCVSGAYYAAFQLTTRGGAAALFDDLLSVDIVARAFEHKPILESYRRYLAVDALNNPNNKGSQLFGASPTEAIELITAVMPPKI